MRIRVLKIQIRFHWCLSTYDKVQIAFSTKFDFWFLDIDKVLQMFSTYWETIFCHGSSPTHQLTTTNTGRGLITVHGPVTFLDLVMTPLATISSPNLQLKLHLHWQSNGRLSTQTMLGVIVNTAQILTAEDGSPANISGEKQSQEWKCNIDMWFLVI